MKIVGSIFILALSLLLMESQYISKKNRAKKEAEKAFRTSKYAEAKGQYVRLKNNLNVNLSEVSLNLAHAYFLQNDSSATLYYRETQGDDKELNSVALQQLAVLLMQKQEPQKLKEQLEEAVKLSQNAIREDYTNERARFNYELLKRLQEALQEQEQQNQDQEQQQESEEQKEQNQEQEQQNQENQEQQNQKSEQEKEQEGKEGEKKEEKPSEAGDKSEEEKAQQKKEDQINQRLRKLNLSREKAEQLFEAMRNQEKQYLQQNRKRSKQANPKNLPDW